MKKIALILLALLRSLQGYAVEEGKVPNNTPPPVEQASQAGGPTATLPYRVGSFSLNGATAVGQAHPESAATGQFGSDEIYFGTKPVHLQPVPGQAVRYDHKAWYPSIEEADIERAVSRAFPGCKGRLGSALADVVIPAVPAVDIVCRSPSTDVSMWPAFLQKPLLKVKRPQPGEPKAYASGVRSAVVKIKEKWYRLKGCGNNDEGFIVRHLKGGGGAVADPEMTTRYIQGSAFAATAARELHMTSMLDEKLQKQNIPGCNKALGYYRYSAPNKPLGGRITPCCIVEETVGDRRLGTHVLGGIEMILPRLVDENVLNETSLLAIYPEKRPGRGHPASLVTAQELMTDYMIAKCNVPPHESHGLPTGYPDLPRDHTLFGTFRTTPLPETAPDKTELPPQLTRTGPQKADPRWSTLWKENCERLTASLEELKDSGKPSVLAYLFSRIGYECGQFLHHLHAMKVSWGTYQDAICLPSQWYCNAHANNLVVNPEGTAGQSFLSYLDLDMAFSADTFLDTWGEGKVGLTDKEFNDLLFIEHVNFMEVIVGSDASNGLPQVAKEHVRSYGEKIKLLQTGLYDTLLQGYMNAYFDDPNYSVCEYDPALQKAAYCIIRLAIIVMGGYVA